MKLGIPVRLLALLCGLLLVGCIDTREEMWVEADGGGRVRIEAEFPAAALGMQGGRQAVEKRVREVVRGRPDLRVRKLEISSGVDRAHAVLEIDFDSVFDLMEFTRSGEGGALPGAVRHLAGEIELDVSGRTLSLERQAHPAKAFPGAAFLPPAALDGHRMTTVVHLPAPAFEHNASRVRNDGRTLVWEVPLSRAVKGAIVSRFKMKVPVPWPWIGGIALGLVVAGGLLVRRVLGRRSRLCKIA